MIPITDQEIDSIKSKMDVLGQMMFDWKQKQQKFEEEHRNELTEIMVRQDELKDEILRLGSSLVSDKLEACYKKARIAWNTTALDTYADLHPEILKYRREGKPYVVFYLRDDEDSIAEQSRKASW